MNVKISDIRRCDSLNAVRRIFGVVLPDSDMYAGGTRLRFTVEPNQFLDVIEIPASDDFGMHFGSIRHNTACLLLCKDDYSEMMFVMKEMGMAGNNVYRKYVINMKKPRNSDAERLKKIRHGSAASFTELFSTKDVVSAFYKKYKVLLGRLQKSIVGIASTADRQHYSQILLSRIMFLCFIQTRGFLSGDTDYLRSRFRDTVQDGENFYRDFLTVLFFDVLNTKDGRRDDFGDIPFLNGGLFRKHSIEEKNSISIENDIFKEVLDFLGSWLWHVDDTTDAASTTVSVNPEILGHIFETMIDDQHGKGAYYTPSDITRYICGQSIIQYCVERVNDRFGTRYNTIHDILLNAQHAEHLYFDVIKPIRILDPACGSGEFILTAYKMLYDLYRETWYSIRERYTKRVRAERKNLGGSPDYHFKRRIITEHVYGVDMEGGALEVCKLRLWLSLVADMDADDIEPLPNIEYNIMQGNSLAGYFTPNHVQQTSLDKPDLVLDILSEIGELKRAYKAERDTTRAEALNKQIIQKISVQKTRLDKAWMSDLGRKSGANVKTVNPFHWTLHFYDVVMTGGFDVIVGNPPWIKTTSQLIPNELKTIYRKQFDTGAADDVYAYFFEMSLKMLTSKGRIGFIVALSSISTGTKAPLTKFLRTHCSELKISSYHDRPGKIFDGKNHSRSAIVLGRHGSEECHIFTTRTHRWRSEDRPTLLSSLKYLRNADFQIGGTSSLYDEGIIPKFGDEIEKSIMAKFLAKPRLVAVQKSGFVLHYHDSMQYWVRVTNHKFKENEHVHSLYLPDKNSLVVTKSLLNSSLVYWFFNKTTNLKEINAHVKHLCIGVIDAADVKTLRRLVKRLDNHYKTRYSAREIKTDSALCKPIIDEIDDILAKHYGFSDAELYYIKNFQVKFRMSDTKQ